MRIRGLAAVVSIVLVACGGDDGEEPDPLVDGSVDGEYDGDSFSAMFGFAAIYHEPGGDTEAPIVGFGDEGIGCSSQDDNDPPPGHSAVVVLDVDVFAEGTYESQFVMIYTNVDEFEGVGSGGATLDLTAVSDATVTGSIEWDYTDLDDRHFSLSGSFEVVRCAD